LEKELGSDGFSPFTVNNLKFPFIFLGCGIVISAFIFLYEKFPGWLVLSKNMKKVFIKTVKVHVNSYPTRVKKKYFGCNISKNLGTFISFVI